MSLSTYKIVDRISWVLWSRVVFLGVMATSAVCLNLVYGDSIPTSILWAILGGLAFSFLSRFSLYFRWKRVVLLGLAYAQILADSLLTSFLVYETGALSSAFVLLYGLNILSAGIILFTRGVLASLAFSLVSYFVVGFSDLSIDSAQEITRFIFVSSMLILVAALVSIAFKNREQLVRSLERTSSDLQSLIELQSAIVDHIPVGLLITGKQGQVLFSNPASHKILGSDFTGKTQNDLPFLNQNQNEFEEISFVKSSQEEVTMLVDRVQIDVDRSLVVLTDISKLRSLELEIRTREKLAGVGQLAAGLAHEIKNPLASLSGSIQMLQGDKQSEEHKEKLMEIILRETDRLDELLNGFLNYAKPSQLRVEETDLRALIEDVVSLMESQAEYKNRIKFQIESDKSALVECDPSKMRQVIWNLLTNAASAIRDLGAVRIQLRNLVDGVRLEIADSGEGIPREIQDRIFEPFFTRKARGTGLGLALVYQIVRAHSGQIGFQSVEGQGSVFWIELKSSAARSYSAA